MSLLPDTAETPAAEGATPEVPSTATRAAAAAAAMTVTTAVAGVAAEVAPTAAPARIAASLEDGPTDEGLMARVAATGDDRAFNELYQRHRRPLHAYLGRLAAGDARAAEEMVQETLERLYKGRGGFDPNRRFRPWLYTIATNVARDRARRASTHRETHADPELWLANLPAPPADGPEAALAARRLMNAAEHAVLALPENERAAFLLVRRAGLEYREAASVLGCSVPAFKMRVSRALERLAHALEPYLEGEP
ncbi:MAG TPA: RNA polymerase sigma factor [Myxococcota bacterium]|jgi:RNA polymerase sigma-70 factor (ECF subfamily)|nr:RNA polymerase sigma factor [Myxococcota bacterium]